MPTGEIVLTDGNGRVLRRLSSHELDALLEKRGGSHDRDQVLAEQKACANETVAQELIAKVFAPDASDAEHMGVAAKREVALEMPKRNPGVTAVIATLMTTTPMAIRRRCGRIGRGERRAEDHPELAQHLDAVRDLTEHGPTRMIRQGATLVLEHFTATP
ncbi:MAG: hypothetical protein A2991_03535 [Candidatus Terrybacteria bacterium RIFCSPLOWO2_01_FULL_58_14]|uniref:Uncharacterized protein n=2 Tax=Candidatus Terryibacteriota TaxID=1817920 RepID=A0A1G2PVT3_9BACT|nr:MAG: hypothetical protein A2682_00545 [Candidatus Terrybacteria bacterium RIFCSPHIGHO2_01_FULL_58_15]OHA52444.1 MAG: hypothetical protein A2991_03535 [Candidatus Terrybacteria bacterium RIFCSPLOWO2_01_FULL_58_14]